MDYLKLTADKLSIEAISELVVDDSCGAVSIFAGTTRDNFEGKKVVRLEYEAYESMALKALKEICNEMRETWSAVHSIAIYHRLGNVPCREASVVIAVSSPHRRESLDAVAFCIDRLKSSVPIWKKEVYDSGAPAWKENQECEQKIPIPSKPPSVDIKPPIIPSPEEDNIDRNLVQINVSNEELQQRIQNFIERKREQVNISNIHDFIPSIGQSETEDMETCARVRTQFVRRSDSKGHLKIHKVQNEWGPQTVRHTDFQTEAKDNASYGLPPAISERVLAIEKFLNTGPVSKDIYKRLKVMEEKIAQLEAMSPEYAQFWEIITDQGVVYLKMRALENGNKWPMIVFVKAMLILFVFGKFKLLTLDKSHKGAADIKQNNPMDYAFSAEDIARKIEQLEKQMKT